MSADQEVSHIAISDIVMAEHDDGELFINGTVKMTFAGDGTPFGPEMHIMVSIFPVQKDLSIGQIQDQLFDKAMQLIAQAGTVDADAVRALFNKPVELNERVYAADAA